MSDQDEQVTAAAGSGGERPAETSPPPSRSISLRRPDGLLVGTRMGEGPRVLLLHAGGERRGVWIEVAAVLAARGYRTEAYDLRGHGDSEAGGGDAFRTHVDDVAAMILAAADPVTVVGASLSGLACLGALSSADVRSRVASVVLVDAIPFLQPDRVRAFLNGAGDGYGERPLVLDVLAHRAELEAGAGGLSGIPTLLALAESSPLAAEDLARFAAAVPHAEIETVHGAGHLVAHDSPVGLTRLLLEHLGSTETRRRRIDLVLDASPAGEMRHPGGSLREHLDRTGARLEAWGAPGWVVDAGRLHAAHGTDGFPHRVPGLCPATVLAAAGPEAERLVDLYCRCDRERSLPELATGEPEIVDRHTGGRLELRDREARALAELTAANELDVVVHGAGISAAEATKLSRLIGHLDPLLSGGAREAWLAVPDSDVAGTAKA